MEKRLYRELGSSENLVDLLLQLRDKGFVGTGIDEMSANYNINKLGSTGEAPPVKSGLYARYLSLITANSEGEEILIGRSQDDDCWIYYEVFSPEPEVQPART